MKLRFAGIVAGFILTVGAAVLVAQQAAQPQAVQEEKVAQLIKDLDSAKFETRSQANEALLKVGWPAVPQLKKALTANPSLEVAVRLRSIIRQLSIRADAGPAAGDLQVRLTADKQAIKPGDTVKFTVALFNISDEDLNVQVGYTTCGNYFECGSAFRRLAVVPGQEPKKEVPASCRVGFCGTGAGPMFVTVPAEGKVEYQVAATFAKPEGSPEGFTFGKNYFTLESPAEGVQTVRVGLNIAPGSNVMRFGPKSGVAPQNEKAAYWNGSVQSNDVQVKIEK